jgi:phosphate:Na+ symporter
VGAVITVLFQSSTATTVILVSLTSASIITLRQALGIILGADIGTTVTAQLIALKVTEVSMPFVIAGTYISFFSKRDRYRKYGQVLLGFGLIFMGLKIMSETMYPLRQDPFFPLMMQKLGQIPLLATLVSMIFTFLICSSAASVGIIMVMAMQHLIDLHSAIYLLFGANMGTSFMALISSLGASRQSQRVAAAHFLFKFSGVLLMLPFVNLFEEFLRKIATTPAYQVANAHALLNVAIALVFLPFTPYFAVLLEKIIPERSGKRAFRPRYLDPRLIKTPSIALGLATKEVMRMWDYIMAMTKNIATVFERNDSLLLYRVNEEEGKVDDLYRETSRYLTDIMRQPLEREEFFKCIALINIINDLEHIGDIMEKNITYLAQTKIEGRSNFSEEGWDEIAILHKRVFELMQGANISFVTGNHELARKVLKLQPQIEKMERHLRVLHIHRLRSGVSEVVSSIHLDLINAFLQISIHLRNIALEVLDEKPDMFTSDEWTDNTARQVPGT